MLRKAWYFSDKDTLTTFPQMNEMSPVGPVDVQSTTGSDLLELLFNRIGCSASTKRQIPAINVQVFLLLFYCAHLLTNETDFCVFFLFFRGLYSTWLPGPPCSTSAISLTKLALTVKEPNDDFFLMSIIYVNALPYRLEECYHLIWTSSISPNAERNATQRESIEEVAQILGGTQLAHTHIVFTLLVNRAVFFSVSFSVLITDRHLQAKQKQNG